MSTPTQHDQPRMSTEQRSALFAELSALHRAENPNGHLCFCGSDAQLAEAVTAARQRAQQATQRQGGQPQRRQREIDDDEIGS